MIKNIFKKKAKPNPSICLTYKEFRKLAADRQIAKNEQFFINYYKQLSAEKGLTEKQAAAALNCIIINEPDTRSRAKSHSNQNTNSHEKPNPLFRRQTATNPDDHKVVDITNTKTLQQFIAYISDRKHLKFVYVKVLTASSCHKHLSLDALGTFIYEVIVDFLRTQCLCKRHQIPSYNLLLSLINWLSSQLSYFNDNRTTFSLGFVSQYLPICVQKYGANKRDIHHQDRLRETEQLLERMQCIDDIMKEYQRDIGDVVDGLKTKCSRLRSGTYPERIDELNIALCDLRKQIETLAEDLTKVENEQLSAERAAEELRSNTLQQFGGGAASSNDDGFNINAHIQSVVNNGNMAESVHSPSLNSNEENDEERRGSLSKSQSHTIDSRVAATSIRKPFFVRPLGFSVRLDQERDGLFVSEVMKDSQAAKLKVVRGWKVSMVGREDRVSVMHNILRDANQQSDDDDALPLFITFQVSL